MKNVCLASFLNLREENEDKGGNGLGEEWDVLGERYSRMFGVEGCPFSCWVWVMMVFISQGRGKMGEELFK